MRFNTFLILIFFTINALSAGTYFKPPALIEGFTTVASAAGTTTLTRASETKLIIIGATTQTVVLPDATTMSTELGRRFYIINKSSGNVTVNASGGGLLTTLSTGTQAEIHLRAAGSAAGTWDVLSSSGGGGGAWGTITGTLSDQTDLNTALGLKAPAASPTFTGTITTPLITDKALVTNGSGALAASGTSATQVGYLSNLSQDVQTSLDAKTDKSTLTTKGDLYVATASATLARQAVGSNGQMLIADSTQTNGVRWAADPDGNLIPDGNAEFGVTNFVEGSYSAATRPAGTFTSSSGSGTFAISTSTSAPLFGATSFLLTKSSGASRQGRAIERTITIDAGYRTKMLKTRIDYTIVSGTFVAGSNGSSPTDSSLIWYVGQYNGSTWSYTEPSTFKMFSNSTTNSDWVEGEFQVNSDTTQIKLIGFISESANSAWVVKAEVGFRLSTFLAGTTISDWKPYTPTITNFGTTSNLVASYRQVGTNEEYKIAFTAGTGAGSLGSISLRPGASLNTNLSQIGWRSSFYNAVGDGSSSSTSSSFSDFKVIANTATSTTAVYLGTKSSTPASNLDPVNGSFFSTTSLDLVFSVPIQGLAATTQQSDGYDGRLINLVVDKTAGAHTSTGNFQDIASWNTARTDKVVGFNSTTGIYTASTYGDYSIGGNITFAVNATGIRVIRVVHNSTVIYEYTALGNATDGPSLPFNVTAYNVKAGDTIKLSAYQSSGGNLNYSATKEQNVLSIFKIQAPTTISATETIAARYTTSSQALGTATVDTVVLTVKDFDTHNAYSTSTGLFTCPVAGFYSVQFNSISGSRSSAVWDYTNYIYVGSTVKLAVLNYSAFASGIHTMNPSAATTVYCGAGETISGRARAGYSGQSLNGSATENVISIFRVK